MKYDVENSNYYGELDNNRLIFFERLIKARLPEDYREFLLKHNGGKPKNNQFNMPDDVSFVDRLHHFYGLNKGPAYQRLDASYQIYRRRIPKSILPIADDPFGNLICIGISDDIYGKIFFWNHDIETEYPSFENVTLLSGSFAEFLDKLYEYRQPHESFIEKAIKEDNVSILKNLIADLDNLEKEDDYGRTMIENAAVNNSVKVIEFLHEKGAKLRNAMEIAESNAEFFDKHKQAVNLLKTLEKKEEKF